MMNVTSVLDQITLFCEKYPQSATHLSQVHLDLTKAKAWKEVRVVEIEPLQRCVIFGKANTETEAQIIVPCSSSESWSIERITLLFSSLQSFLNEPSYKSVTLAITFPDSTVVYYKVHEGIVPPTNDCVS
ncbi:hypothetical protein RclHR1_02930012 [Rhizophagus clarus]|uniref:tRNA-splicing endonuclease subunit Sen15 domain-containing protein n=1 Tax=Rhizophagus clarus TaxID=94130 RepID=A0A2Z6R4E7_9GLOM|nr:hypothetical protein RclHR1_02930012 [Rhizophagus clarus]